ncbi:MAG: ribosome biogenesis factor YjgA [Kofleriaceae bacterium]
MRAMSARDDGTRSARQIARGRQRKAGDRSARLANALMKLSATAVKKLELDEDLREAVERARAVTSHGARRRAERTLAGDLRRFDLVALDAQLAKVHESGNADVREFHLAEQWRARMIEEGIAAIAAFPGGRDEQLPRLIDAAQRERATGRPPGAARSLFRHIVALLKVQRVDATDADEADDQADQSDETDEADEADEADDADDADET